MNESIDLSSVGETVECGHEDSDEFVFKVGKEVVFWAFFLTFSISVGNVGGC